MKTKMIHIIRILLLSALTVSISCTDFLDKTPDEDMSIEEAFKDRKRAERWLNTCYFNLNEEYAFNEWWGRNPYVTGADEAEITWTYPFSQKLNDGSWSPNDKSQTDNNNKVYYLIYNFMYEGSRKLNLFLDNIGITPMDPTEKEHMIGEAVFLRAFYHFWVIRAFGPVCLADHTFSATEDYITLKRHTYEQCIQFVVDECDRAYALLPANWASDANMGRATRVAAKALKARALLYAASDLFNGNPDYSSLVDKDGVRLFPDRNDDKWQKAADAALDCINEAKADGHALYYAASKDPVDNYAGIFNDNWNCEVLFARNLNNNSKWYEQLMAPNGMGGWSGICPTQEQVDAYEMRNGKAPIVGYNADGSPKIDPESGYTETGLTTQAGAYWPAGTSNMYKDRDPRFYASILFNGVQWRGRDVQFYMGGLDGGSNPVDYTKTGYLMRKFASPSANIVQDKIELHTWIYFRLGGVYLDYAEALNEAQGPVDDVYFYVNEIRKRAGMPELPTGLSKEAMRSRIRNERRVELAFETHRFFDCHRWKIAEQTDNREIHGVDITKGNVPEFYNRRVVEKRVFEKKHYLFPIPQSEIEKVPTLVQNPFWEKEQ